jgi:integrase
MDAYPFCVFKRTDRPCFLVKFKDEAGNYLPPVSTKKKDRDEAVQVAFKLLRDGIPQKKEALKVNDLSLKDVARKIQTGTEAEKLLSELKVLGMVKNYVLNDTPQAEDFISFLKTFWDWETSPYIKEKLRKNHGIHKRHCKLQGQAIALYWEPFFKGRFMGDITAMDIDAFITHMGERDLSAARKNVVIKAGTKPLRWAFSKGLIDKDPTRGHILFSGDELKRNILTPAVVAAIFRASWKNERAKLGNMLAAVTGMRSGEIQALRFKDLGNDCLYVNASWNKEDDLKPTKNNESRTVEIPFPDLMNSLIEQAQHNPWGVSPDSYVFWSETSGDMPIHGTCFLDGLRKALVMIGFSESQAAKYMFHGWRHFFTSYMIGKLDKKLLKSQTGHKTDVMLAHYADHCIEGDREIIQATEREAFAGLLPEKNKLLVFKREPEKIAVNQ